MGGGAQTEGLGHRMKQAQQDPGRRRRSRPASHHVHPITSHTVSAGKNSAFICEPGADKWLDKAVISSHDSTRPGWSHSGTPFTATHCPCTFCSRASCPALDQHAQAPLHRPLRMLPCLPLVLIRSGASSLPKSVQVIPSVFKHQGQQGSQRLPKLISTQTHIQLTASA